MSRSSVMIANGDLLLDGSVARAPGPDVAVLCHPHPLYGGDMDNNVVVALDECFFGMGCTTVRFNFRGVGRSTGSYGDGIAETEDLASVVAHVAKAGDCHLHLAGYSFGAWVILNGVKQGIRPASLVLASPPLDFMDFQALNLPGCPTLIVLGDSDSFCSIQSFQAWLNRKPSPSASPKVAFLPGCDHFYWGYEEKLGEQVTAFLREVLPEGGSEKSHGPDR